MSKKPRGTPEDGHFAGPLDSIDKNLVAELTRDGRVSVSDLAERVGTSRPNAHWRFQRLRDRGVIRGFTAVLDRRALGLEVTALIMISVEQDSWREVRAELESVEEIEYVAFTSGDFDFLILVRSHDMTAIRDVVLERLQSMGHIKSTKTVFVLDEGRRGPVYI
jgi:Lrp/AsnC family transcriptional regulator, leucine-responsive regulatory protein